MTKTEFERRVHENHAKLMNVARRMLPRQECEDAVQNAILSAWKNLDQLRDDQAFDGWLRQILLNECRAYYRKRGQDARIQDALVSQQHDAPDEIGLDDALNTLSDAEKNLLLLHHEQGRTLSELSKELGESEAVLKMRLYRARKRLRIALVSLLLLLLLLAAAAIGTGYLDVNWFLSNRRASNPPLYAEDSQRAFDISYDGQLLQAEISDAVWDTQKRSLMITYSLTGTDDNALTVHDGSIGVDGERFDHIWIGGQVLPIDIWANGKPVHTYSLGGWMLDGKSLHSSEDYLPDGYGESFFTELRFEDAIPQQHHDADEYITITNPVFIQDYATNEALEEGTLTVRVACPDIEAWQYKPN